MGAQIITKECSFCGGSGTAEHLMEKTEAGTWVKNAILLPRLADALIEDGYKRLKWQKCDCPKCFGKGDYQIEMTPCRIF